jgi:microcystin-dependent protein
MAGLFSRLKIWNPGESLTASDLNGEFNHFLSNIDGEHSEGYSANLSEMQTTENPGGLGSENLTQPISVAQEIERLRFVINRVIGKSYWYQAPAQSIEGLNSTVSGVFGVSPSRIVSGQKTALSGFPTFLQANGAAGVRLNASAGTPFNCFIDTNYFSYTANISSGVLSGQPANNTATLASSLGGGQASRNATEFVISSAGAGITSNIGRQAIFLINNGSSDEYFLGTIASSTIITGIKRGYFYDTSNVAVAPITLTTGHTITLLRTTYVFLRNDGTLQVTYNPPSYMGTAPISPSINDYWFDMTVNSWKIFNGNWVSANSVYIGMCAQGPVNTVCARSENIFANYSDIFELQLRDLTNSSVSSRFDLPAKISVYGSLVRNDFRDFLWDMTSNMFPGETEAANTTYFFYLNNVGTSYISAVQPTYDGYLQGYYHPYEALRCVGFSNNDGSSNLSGLFTYSLNESSDKTVPVGTVLAHAASSAPSGFLICNGSAVSRSLYSNLFYTIGTEYGTGDGSTTFNLPDLRYNFIRGSASNISVTGSGTAGSNQATFTAHGINRTGMRVRLSSGTLSGLAASTNYFAIVVDANTLAFASSYANAIANTRVAISGANSAVIIQWEDPDIGSRLQAAVGGATSGVGTRQDDQNLSHNHSVSWGTGSPYTTGGPLNASSGSGAFVSGIGISSLTINSNGGNQSNPRNVYMNYIIKF